MSERAWKYISFTVVFIIGFVLISVATGGVA